MLEFKKWIAFALFLIVSFGVYWFFLKEKPQVKYIAYVGRFTNDKDTLPVSEQQKSDFHKFHVDVLERKIKELNTNNKSVEFKLKVFDCEQNPEKSKSIYSEIVKDPSIISVIDNTWGVDIEGAQEVIKSNNIPVIAINADKNGLDFGSAAIFTDNNDLLPIDLVVFCKKILHKDTLDFISEVDYKLHNVFVDVFEKEGVVVDKTFEIKGIDSFNSQDSSSFFNSIREYYSTHPKDNHVIVVNTHYELGNKILKYIDENEQGKIILGHAYISSLKEKDLFQGTSNNELILMTDPDDAVSKKIHQFEESLLKNHPEYKERKNNEYFIRRCFDANALLKYSIVNKDLKLLSRDTIRSEFEKLKSKRISIDNEIYEFNAMLEAQKESFFSAFKNGETFTFPEQLNLSKEVIPDMLFGMDIQDIFEIDLNTNSFTSDFYYWIKHDTLIENAEKFVLFQNMKQSESSIELIQEKRKDGIIYKLFKVSGQFFVDYDESHYPFDKQELEISVQILVPAEKLRVSFDKESFIQDREKIENFTISSWEKKKYYVTVDNVISSNIRGDIENKHGLLNKYKTINFRLDIERRQWSGIVQVVLPLIFIGLISIALLYVRNMTFENLGEASVGTFFSIIAFSISLSDISPSSDLITKADKVFLLTFVTVFLSFLTIIVLNSVFEEKEIIGKKNIHVDRIRLGMSIAYPLLFIWFIWF